MKAVYFRSNDCSDFLIPEDLIHKFDRDYTLVEEASMSDTDDGELYYTLAEEFDEKYSEYVVEGDLYNIKFYINEG